MMMQEEEESLKRSHQKKMMNVLKMKGMNKKKEKKEDRQQHDDTTLQLQLLGLELKIPSKQMLTPEMNDDGVDPRRMKLRQMKKTIEMTKKKDDLKNSEFGVIL